MKTDEKNPKYRIGQKVIIRPVADQPASARESDIHSYAGKVGEVSNFYWINPRTSQVFYVYTVSVGPQVKDLVLYEDEMEACIK
jgi:hypothetical protein